MKRIVLGKCVRIWAGKGEGGGRSWCFFNGTATDIIYLLRTAYNSAL